MISEMVQSRRVSRLKALLENMKEDGYKSYASIERDFGISASFLSQIVNGTRSFGEAAARGMEEKLGLTQMYFDDGSFFADADVNVDSYKLQLDSKKVPSVVLNIYEKCVFDKNGISFKDSDSMTVMPTDFFQSRDLGTKDFKLMKADNNSMSPFINDNDIVGIDLTDTHIKDGSIYAIAIDGDLMFRQVFREAAGALRLHSFNSEYPDRVFSKDDLNAITIVGKQNYRAG